MNGIIETGYLHDVGITNAYLYYIADDGYEVRILKNGEDMIATLPTTMATNADCPARTI